MDTLTLLPGPLHEVEIWQAVTSPPTLTYAAEVGHGCVWWNQYHGFVRDQWERYAELYEQHHDVSLTSGAKRILVLPVHIADDHETAWRVGGAGHDEFWNLLAPFGWSRGYRGDDGKPAKPGLVPTLQQSTEQKMGRSAPRRRSPKPCSTTRTRSAWNTWWSSRTSPATPTRWPRSRCGASASGSYRCCAEDAQRSVTITSTRTC